MKLVILGGGESGVGAAILGKTKGYEVFLSDFGTIPERYRIQLDEEGIEWEQGGHSMDRILSADEVVKSPGIPPTAPVVREIRAKGIPVISEIEFAGRYTDARMVCITGSNGKTTTTLLTYHILKDAGLNVGLAGNVGKSLALQVARENHDVYVIELSSFQLENMYDFHANIAVILNITPDHLDRYDYEMQNYVNAKFRILNNLTPRDAFIYWEDDPVIRRQLEHVVTEAARFPFAERMEEVDGYEPCAWVDNEDMLNVRTPDRRLRMPRAELSLNGLHNLYNSMAAALSASILDIADEDIRRGLSSFEGVEHRLEPAGTVNGVRYINDSKATNVNSTWYALESMPADTILILGGKDKGNDYSEILPLVKEKVRAIVCMGKDNGKLLDFFTGEVPEIYDTHSIEEAVGTCADIARPGDTVLLSPCCASFDLFKSYEDRGCHFKEQVSRLSSDDNLLK